MPPIYTCFFTPGTLYEQEAARLRASLDKLGLPHDLRAVESRGDWVANTRMTADHICTMLAAYPDRPIVQLDADAVVWSVPELFEQLPALGMDIAVHYRRGVELLNGTVWLNNTPGARMVAEKYRDLITANSGCANEQTMLAAAIGELSDLIHVYRLPPSYCWIFDIMKDDRGREQPVIEMLQASRERSHCEAWQRRRDRIKQVEALL